jgi:hypothetical protein
VTSQASDVHKREISINPFDCPRDKRSSRGLIAIMRIRTRADHYAARRTGPEREDDQRLRWSSAWGSPPPESNRRPHPYHGSTAKRRAIPRLRRSHYTARAVVMGPLRASTFGVSSRSRPSHHIHHEEQGQEQADDADARPATVMLRLAAHGGPTTAAPTTERPSVSRPVKTTAPPALR